MGHFYFWFLKYKNDFNATVFIFIVFVLAYVRMCKLIPLFYCFCQLALEKKKRKRIENNAQYCITSTKGMLLNPWFYCFYSTFLARKPKMLSSLRLFNWNIKQFFRRFYLLFINYFLFFYTLFSLRGCYFFWLCVIYFIFCVFSLYFCCFCSSFTFTTAFSFFLFLSCFSILVNTINFLLAFSPI